MFIKKWCCVCDTDLRGESSLVVQQRLAERLLETLVHVCKAQHLFLVGCGEVQESLVAWSEGLLLPGDQQHTVPVIHRSLTLVQRFSFLLTQRRF